LYGDVRTAEYKKFKDDVRDKHNIEIDDKFMTRGEFRIQFLELFGEVTCYVLDESYPIIASKIGDDLFIDLPSEINKIDVYESFFHLLSD